MSPISLNPEDFTEGGEFPRGTLEITGARFGIHEFIDRDGNPVKSSYGEGNVAPSMAAILDLTNVDSGTVFPNRVYTIGQPSRYTASMDGSTLEGESITGTPISANSWQACWSWASPRTGWPSPISMRCWWGW